MLDANRQDNGNRSYSSSVKQIFKWRANQDMTISAEDVVLDIIVLLAVRHSQDQHVRDAELIKAVGMLEMVLTGHGKSRTM